MKNRLFKVIEPRFRLCFAFLLVFAISSAFFNPYLSALEFLLIGFVCWLFYRNAKAGSDMALTYAENAITPEEYPAGGVISHFQIPMIIVRTDTTEIVWNNDKFAGIVPGGRAFFEKRLSDLLPGFNLRWLMSGDGEYLSSADLGGRQYKIYGNMLKNQKDRNNLKPLCMLYFIDITELAETRRELFDSRMISAIIVFDNYDELIQGTSESERSLLYAKADVELDKWGAKANGILRKVERDTYLFFFPAEHLQMYLDEKFSILDKIRGIEGSNKIKLTLSIGMGRDGATFAENFSFAQLALETALSRGGDQVVIRHKVAFDFYGGTSKEIEKRAKVKARVKASALSELMKDAESVMVMGHHNADIDSMGASIGIVTIARKLDTVAKIVINSENMYATALFSKISNQEAYKNVFISAEDALVSINENTLLIVVDTNRPKYVESQSLLEAATKIVVIDHHRRAADYIENAVLNFHEPYASSTCELVSEALQYIVTASDMLKEEAEALLAGIVLDTKNFSIKTGVRTFEAAAFLRAAGADTSEVKRLFQNDLDDYVQRADIVKLAKIHKNTIAIVEYNGTTDRVTASQAADDLLNITKIQASFVLFYGKDAVTISARSLGDINVQVILEKLGGGGHIAAAGAQIKNADMQEVKARLIEAIDSVVTD